jgi:hypothetical protein
MALSATSLLFTSGLALRAFGEEATVDAVNTLYASYPNAKVFILEEIQRADKRRRHARLEFIGYMIMYAGIVAGVVLTFVTTIPDIAGLASAVGVGGVLVGVLSSSGSSLLPSLFVSYRMRPLVGRVAFQTGYYPWRGVVAYVGWMSTELWDGEQGRITVVSNAVISSAVTHTESPVHHATILDLIGAGARCADSPV